MPSSMWNENEGKEKWSKAMDSGRGIKIVESCVATGR